MHDETDLAELTTIPHEYEAQLIIAALEEKGIPAQQAGGAVSNFKVGAPGGVTIYVKPEDHDRAVQAYAEIREESDHIDWSKVDVDGTDEPEQ